MKNNKDRYTTKLTVEITVETQFGPDQAIGMIDTMTRYPTVKSLNVIKLETDYVPDKNFPNDIAFKAMNNIPRKVR